jgi:hypothetical protein
LAQGLPDWKTTIRTTVTQIARAIDYTPERMATALQRMEKAGQVLRMEGRSAIARIAFAEDHRMWLEPRDRREFDEIVKSI